MIVDTPSELHFAHAGGAERKTQIVIVGGGAAGLELAARLGRRYGRKHHDIILVERNRTHIWKPLLHEVATGALDANIDEVGYRAHCHRFGYRFFNGSLESVDTEARRIHLAPLIEGDREIIARHSLRYDYLVLAYGSVTNDFGTPGVSEYCLALDSREDADRFRNSLINQCLRVSRSMLIDPGGDARVRISIVGAGATGVELAAELYNAANALAFYGLEVFDGRRLEVSLIEAGPRILPALPERLAAAAHKELEKLGVRVLTGTAVTRVTQAGIEAANGDVIPADLKIWAAGVKATPIRGTLGHLEVSRNGQILTTDTLQTRSDPRIFAIGDCASCTPAGRDSPVPPRAQAAHQMATHTFRNLGLLMAGRSLKPFVYRDKGSLVSLSRFSTVGSLMGSLVGGSLAIEGRLARLVYTSLYHMHLIAIHGWPRGIALIAFGRVHSILRPRLKLH
ncbi:NAD(P)/FAD-dependent oxidoreductase [Sphingomonas sp.]|uniref:NAD(P)/FAD-dependent oxidoreductase n=1 Tax=Sphingomonas sp. TaxID=28214 RepID=UPI000DAFE417|nr:NAD(P)/FAD-dependent oxidoreductase [Sphingomonas sp.]PZU09646.1 MAG: FAD-dependent oxidoreductase [Sphingomonas sp.]